MKLKRILTLTLLIITFVIIPNVFSSPLNESEDDSKFLTLMGELVDPKMEDYEYKDWKQTTIDYLNYVLDDTNGFTDPRNDSGLAERNAKIGRYANSTNASAYFNETIEAWGLPSYIGYTQQDNDLGEAIAVLSAIMSGGLAGLDMTNYSAPGRPNFNYVKGALNYYNSEGVILNGGGNSLSGATFWYDLLPGVLFTVIASQYPSEQYYTYDVLSTMADGWYKAVVAMGGPSADFYHLGYSISQDNIVDGGHYEPDSAAGIAYILYSAYQALSIEGQNTYATEEQLDKFLQGAIWSMNYLDRIDFNPSYEVFQLFAPYIAARMNVEQKTNYNITKMFNDAISGNSRPRNGWGMIFEEKWGDYYAQGLMGAQKDNGGYAFNMGTFDAMMGFAPLVKYDKRYAYDVSRWVLAVSQSAQNFYPDKYTTDGEVVDFGTNTVWHGEYQSSNMIKQDDAEASFIPYEGLRKHPRYVQYSGNNRYLSGPVTSKSPYASGDAYSFNWGGRTDYGLYGGSHVGTFSAINETNVPMILETDLDLLDVFTRTDGVFYKMYYNPHENNRTLEVKVSDNTNKLYNTLTGAYLNTSVVDENTLSFEIDPKETIVTAELPSHATLRVEGNNVLYGDIVIAQNRSSISATLKDDQGVEINPNASVSGIITTDLNIKIPENLEITEIKISIGNHVYYDSDVLPNKSLDLDTTLASNGTADFSIRVVLENEIIETVRIPIRVVNMVITPAFSYKNSLDMINQWNDATQLINSAIPQADHDTTVSLNANDEMVITTDPGFSFGFASSQDFYVDFTREPIFDIEILNSSSEYTIKFYVEDTPWHISGEYLVENTLTPDTYSFNLLEALQSTDPTFMPVGTLKSSIHIGVVGNNATVTVGDFSVYHLYETPNLDEPNYSWGFDFYPSWISLWSNNPSTGALGLPELIYNEQGESIVESNDGLSAIASKAITADRGQNPVINIIPKSLEGSYFVGIKFVESDEFYYLSDEISSTSPQEFTINKLLEDRYPDLKLSEILNIRIMIGVTEGSSLNINKIETYYQLPQWGSSVSLEDWVDWEKQPGYGDVSYNIDVNKRVVVTNMEPSSSTTQLAGFRGKFTVNFDYNPQLDFVVRAATGSYRLVLQLMDTNERIIIKDWGQEVSRNPMIINLKDVLGNKKIYGLKSVYFVIEILGGQNNIIVESLNTYYVSLSPSFGNTYNEEIATWNKGSNPSFVSIIQNGFIKISQNNFDSNGLYTSINVSDKYNPLMIVDYSSVKTGSIPYIIFTYQGEEFTYLPDITESMTHVIDINKILGINVDEPYNLDIEVGASGTFFEIVIESIEFIYRLKDLDNANFNRESNKVTWDSVEGALSYDYEIIDENLNSIKTGNINETILNLDDFNLNEGIYNVYIKALGTGYKDSEAKRVAILQGDIESVQLESPNNVELNGTELSFDEVNNSLGYYIIIKDASNQSVIYEGLLEVNILDLISLEFPAFNYTVEIYAEGDGLVYLDSETINYEFHTKPIAYFSAESFSNMGSAHNNTTGIYNEDNQYTELVINDKSSTWGGVQSIPIEINFDNNPMLVIEFDETSTFGYFLQMNIDGVTYYLADDTFNFNKAYIDINKEILDREPDAKNVLTGIKSATIVFGTTSGNPSDIPSVKYRNSYVYELTKGHGEEMLGQLSSPVVEVKNKVATWEAVPNATSYVFILKNEVGIVIQKTLTELTYDFSIILAGGEYEINVIAKGNNYFDSEAGINVFTLENEIPDENDNGTPSDGDNSKVVAIVLSSVSVLLLAAASVFIVIKIKKPKL